MKNCAKKDKQAKLVLADLLDKFFFIQVGLNITNCDNESLSILHTCKLKRSKALKYQLQMIVSFLSV